MNKKTRRVIGLVIIVIFSLILVGVMAQLLAVLALSCVYGISFLLAELLALKVAMHVLYLLFWLIASLTLLDIFIFNSRIFNWIKHRIRKIGDWMGSEYQKVK